MLMRYYLVIVHIPFKPLSPEEEKARAQAQLEEEKLIKQEQAEYGVSFDHDYVVGVFWYILCSWARDSWIILPAA